jgi:outer membrane biosynthesis protein TonB
MRISNVLFQPPKPVKPTAETPTPTSTEPAPDQSPTPTPSAAEPAPSEAPATSTTSAPEPSAPSQPAEPVAAPVSGQASGSSPVIVAASVAPPLVDNQVSDMPDAVRQLSIEVASGRFLEKVIAELRQQGEDTSFIEAIAETTVRSKADIIRDASVSLRAQANHTRDSVMALIRE